MDNARWDNNNNKNTHILIIQQLLERWGVLKENKKMEKLIAQIAKEMLAEEKHISHVKVEDGMVDFYYCNQWWWGKVTKTNKLKKNSTRKNNF